MDRRTTFALESARSRARETSLPRIPIYVDHLRNNDVLVISLTEAKNVAQ